MSKHWRLLSAWMVYRKRACETRRRCWGGSSSWGLTVAWRRRSLCTRCRARPPPRRSHSLSRRCPAPMNSTNKSQQRLSNATATDASSDLLLRWIHYNTVMYLAWTVCTVITHALLCYNAVGLLLVQMVLTKLTLLVTNPRILQGQSMLRQNCMHLVCFF